MKVYVAIKDFVFSTLIVSRTRVGLAEEIKCSVKSVERALSKIVEENAEYGRIGKGWMVKEVEAIENQGKGNALNFKAGYKGKDGKVHADSDGEN